MSILITIINGYGWFMCMNNIAAVILWIVLDTYFTWRFGSRPNSDISQHLYEMPWYGKVNICVGTGYGIANYALPYIHINL